MLEARLYQENAFLTLTYDEANLPADMSVDSIVLQRFLKRLRKWYSPERFRYYGVGEYGELTKRPHYHLILFGFPTCLYLRTRTRKERDFTCCAICGQVARLWGLGNVYLGQVEDQSAEYVAGYVNKKFDVGEDEVKRPPFSRMSNRPGIGADAMDEIASVLLEEEYSEADVPSSLLHGKRHRPLGRYLRKRLRERIGRDGGAPIETKAQIQAELSDLRKIAHAIAPPGSKEFIFKQEVIKAGEARRRRMEFWEGVKGKSRRTS